MRPFTAKQLQLLRRAGVSHELVVPMGVGSGECLRNGSRQSQQRCLHTSMAAEVHRPTLSPNSKANAVPAIPVPVICAAGRGVHDSNQWKRNPGAFFRPGIFAERHNQRATAPESAPAPAHIFPRLPTSRLTKHPNPVPGFNVMVQLILYLDDKIGSCPSEELLVTAYSELLGEYFDSKGQVKLGRELLEEHSYVLMRVYLYLCELKKKEVRSPDTDIAETQKKPHTSPLSIQTLKNTMSVLHIANKADPPSAYFSRMLFVDLMAREDVPISTLRSALQVIQTANNLSQQEIELARSLFQDIVTRPGYEPLPNEYLFMSRVLNNSGATKDDETLTLCSAAWDKYKEKAVTYEVWEEVLRGYAEIGDEIGFDRAWDMIVRQYEIEPDVGMWHQRIVVHCAVREGLDAAKAWWTTLRWRIGAPEPALDTYEALLRFYSRRNKDLMADDLLWYMLTRYEERPPKHGSHIEVIGPKKWWAAIARWASAKGIGWDGAGVKPGMDSVSFVFDKMAKLHKEGKHWVPMPDSDVVSEVVEFLVNREKWSTAEDVLELAEKWHIAPDRKIWSLKTQILVYKKDWDSAWNAYEAMKVYPIPDGDDAIELRKLIRGLASVSTGLGEQQTERESPKDGGVKITWGTVRMPPPVGPGGPTPISKINYLLSDLNDRCLNLDINTLSALIVYHLSTNTLASIPPILSSTTYTLSASALNRLTVLFLTHIESPRTSLVSAWDSYLIMQAHFPASSLSPAIRIKLMQIFFSLDRSDMAVAILTHTPTPPAIPLPMFITALGGLAKCRDVENLQLVHNLVNLSPEIPVPPPVELLNALMNAFSWCGLYERAMRFWGTIRRSRAGPDHTSISIVLDMCGRRNGWINEAKQIWGTLQKLKITPSMGNYATYVEALSKQGLYNEAWDIVKGIEGEVGERPDEHVLTTLYKCTPRDRRGMIDKWAAEKYPDIWNPWRRADLERLRAREEAEAWREGIGNDL